MPEENGEHPLPAGQRGASEAALIAAEYERRQREVPAERYSVTTPGALFVRQATERSVVHALKRIAAFPLRARSILDIGCGDGGWLLTFESFGAQRQNLAGIDLIEDRAETAKARLSGPMSADVRSGDASCLPWADDSFDVVFQSMVLSSIDDFDMRSAIAAEAIRVVRPGGCIISFDFWIDNPLNPRVRGVSLRHLRLLFPGFDVHARRAVLAPPIARKLARISWSATELIQATKLLNAQLTATVRRAGSPSA